MLRRFVYVLAIGWLLAMVLSVLLPALTPATGDGFTRGLNRVGTFLVWQTVALGVAIVVIVMSRSAADRSGRLFKLAAFGPMSVSGLMVLLFVGVVLWARFAPYSVPDTPPATITEPTPAPASDTVQ